MWACQDPAWDHCLALLASELAGTPSRVLITCRRPIAALAATGCHRVLLGPLPPGEAGLYLREHAGLSKMVFGGDPAEHALAKRLLSASRFYPLLMDRLARLATGGPALRAQLMQAFDTLEKSKDFAQLPGFVRRQPRRGQGTGLPERRPHDLARPAHPRCQPGRPPPALDDRPGQRSRQPRSLLKGTSSGESHEQQQLRQIKQMLENLPTLPGASGGVERHAGGTPPRNRRPAARSRGTA